MLVQRWQQYLITHAKPDHPVLGPMNQLALLPDDQFAERSAEILKAGKRCRWDWKQTS